MFLKAMTWVFLTSIVVMSTTVSQTVLATFLGVETGTWERSQSDPVPGKQKMVDEKGLALGSITFLQVLTGTESQMGGETCFSGAE